jgi:hypothetical protein
MAEKSKDTIEVDNAINPFARKGYMVSTSDKMTADIGSNPETMFKSGNLKDKAAAKHYGNPGGYPGLAGLNLKDDY